MASLYHSIFNAFLGFKLHLKPLTNLPNFPITSYWKYSRYKDATEEHGAGQHLTQNMATRPYPNHALQQLNLSDGTSTLVVSKETSKYEGSVKKSQQHMNISWKQ